MDYMPLTRSTKEYSEKMEDFKLHLIDAIKDKEIAANLVQVNKKSFDDFNQCISDLREIINILKNQLTARDSRIEVLEKENAFLKIKVDDQEQYTRRASVRVFGVPETTPGSCDEKVLALCNTHMKLEPPLQLEDIEVSHRAGGNRGAAETNQGHPRPPTAGPRAILVKFVSRRTKARVMQSKKKLRSVTEEGDAFPNPVFVSDDLTPRRAKLAFEARGLKKRGKIRDTWIFDSRVLIKDNHGNIKPINSDADLNRYKN